MQCTNKIKQIGLAMHNYHDTFGRLPASNATVEWSGGARREHNWTLGILDFMEMTAIADQFDYLKPLWDRPSDWANQLDNPNSVFNYKFARMIHPEFLCPSDPYSEQVSIEDHFTTTWELSQCDYAINIGDYKNVTGIGYGSNAGNGIVQVRGVSGTDAWETEASDSYPRRSTARLIGPSPHVLHMHLCNFPKDHCNLT